MVFNFYYILKVVVIFAGQAFIVLSGEEEFWFAAFVFLGYFMTFWVFIIRGLTFVWMKGGDWIR